MIQIGIGLSSRRVLCAVAGLALAGSAMAASGTGADAPARQAMVAAAPAPPDVPPSSVEVVKLADGAVAARGVGDALGESLVVTKAADGSLQYRCVKGSGADGGGAAGSEAH